MLIVCAGAQVQRYADDSFYAFTRGNVFVATTNVGSSGQQVVRTITYHPYREGARLCNMCVTRCPHAAVAHPHRVRHSFWQGDCVQVQNTQFTVTLLGGESKVFVLSN